MDEKRLGASFCPSPGQIRWFLTVLVAFAALVRLMVAYITVHYFDLSFSGSARCAPSTPI